MSSNHPSDSVSLSSTPRSDPPPSPPPVRLMCSFGGRILPRPHDNQLRYVGGDTRIVAVNRSATFAALHSKISKLAAAASGSSTAGSSDAVIKYQLPNEDLDALISITSDEDVENMMEEYDRLSAADAGGRSPRLRLFLFPAEGGFGSILEGSGSKRDSWFVDALNGGSGGGLERGRSEASSILSEVPDYLFGLDNSSDEPKHKFRFGPDTASEPGSPIPATSSPVHYSAASAAPPVPPVKIAGPVEPVVQPQTGYATNPVWHYVPEPVPVYYVPGPVHDGSMQVRPGPVPVQYYNQVPVGYNPPVQPAWTNRSHVGPVYMTGPPAEVQQVGGMMRNPGAIPVYSTAGVAPVSGEPPAAGGHETRVARESQ